MAYRLIYTKAAGRDLAGIVSSIARDDRCAAENVGLKLIELAESLTLFPHQGTAVRKRVGVRKVQRAPYVVLYRVDETREMVRVQRFWRIMSDPQSRPTE
jgi:plasmid stabilization system protein ParE